MFFSLVAQCSIFASQRAKSALFDPPVEKIVAQYTNYSYKTAKQVVQSHIVYNEKTGSDETFDNTYY